MNIYANFWFEMWLLVYWLDTPKCFLIFCELIYRDNLRVFPHSNFYLSVNDNVFDYLHQVCYLINDIIMLDENRTLIYTSSLPVGLAFDTLLIALLEDEAACYTVIDINNLCF